MPAGTRLAWRVEQCRSVWQSARGSSTANATVCRFCGCVCRKWIVGGANGYALGPRGRGSGPSRKLRFDPQQCVILRSNPIFWKTGPETFATRKDRMQTDAFYFSIVWSNDWGQPYHTGPHPHALARHKPRKTLGCLHTMRYNLAIGHRTKVCLATIFATLITMSIHLLKN